MWHRTLCIAVSFTLPNPSLSCCVPIPLNTNAVIDLTSVFLYFIFKMNVRKNIKLKEGEVRVCVMVCRQDHLGKVKVWRHLHTPHSSRNLSPQRAAYHHISDKHFLTVNIIFITPQYFIPIWHGMSALMGKDVLVFPILLPVRLFHLNICRFWNLWCAWH